ncbi:unnamed protein product, partial [Amoebophrya sp. A120]|eukprot:GSA120T00017991001.1
MRNVVTKICHCHAEGGSGGLAEEHFQITCKKSFYRAISNSLGIERCISISKRKRKDFRWSHGQRSFDCFLRDGISLTSREPTISILRKESPREAGASVGLIFVIFIQRSARPPSPCRMGLHSLIVICRRLLTCVRKVWKSKKSWNRRRCLSLLFTRPAACYRLHPLPLGNVKQNYRPHLEEAIERKSCALQ